MFRNRRGPKPDLFEGTYLREFEVSLFRRDGSPEAWWIRPDTLDGTPGLEPDGRGHVHARVRLTGWVSEPGGYGHLGMYDRELDVLHVQSAEPIRPARRREVGYVTYTLEADDMDAAAALVAGVLGVTLHVHHSPMIGRWYADLESADLAGRSPSDASPIVRVMVTANDPEPGVVSPYDPDGLPYVLSILMLPGLEDHTEWSLAQAGIRFQPLGVRSSE